MAFFTTEEVLAIRRDFGTMSIVPGSSTDRGRFQNGYSNGGDYYYFRGCWVTRNSYELIAERWPDPDDDPKKAFTQETVDEQVKEISEIFGKEGENFTLSKFLCKVRHWADAQQGDMRYAIDLSEAQYRQELRTLEKLKNKDKPKEKQLEEENVSLGMWARQSLRDLATEQIQTTIPVTATQVGAASRNRPTPRPLNFSNRITEVQPLSEATLVRMQRILGEASRPTEETRFVQGRTTENSVISDDDLVRY